MSDAQFLGSLETGVRPWVERLRAAGVNTEASCGHEGYIQCQSLDPAQDVEKIKRILHNHGLWRYSITWTYESWGEDYSGWRQSLDVRSLAFRAELRETP